MVTRPTEQAPVTDGTLDYLRVDSFMAGIVEARALKTGLDLHLIDYLIENDGVPRDTLDGRFGADEKGLDLLLGLLKASGVLMEEDGYVSLSKAFRKALEYRDLLEVKLELAHLVLPDFIDLFDALIGDPDRFQRNARIFRLFSYGRAFGTSHEDYEWTRRWMRVTTVLTKYEGPVCLHLYDFGQHARILDIGGNSGEFALCICRKYDRIRVTVFDLPLVCAAGRKHVADHPGHERIEFLEGDALAGPMPGDFDLIVFKSMLHDWPNPDAKALLTRAAQTLRPGGRILIFERAPLQMGGRKASFSLIPFLLFFRFLRDPGMYEEHLRRLGFRDIITRETRLDTAFHILSATKG